jgi:glucose-1-phosphate adenylyltransferase
MGHVSDRARDVIVAILGGGRGTRLSPLTDQRSKPAVPIAGKYRLIDIPISNAIHSQMQRILVLTQFNSTSLHRHINLTYKFDQFSRGYVQILAAQQTLDSQNWYMGTADAIRKNLRLISEVPGDLVLILSGDHMYRMDYRAMLEEHLETEADITIGVLPCTENDIAGFGAARVDDSGRILEFREKPSTPEAREGMQVSAELLDKAGIGHDRPYIASMGIYIFRKQVLIDCLNNELVEFGGDIIPGCIASQKVQSHFFGGYWRDIGTIRSFFETHMDLVKPVPPFRFTDSNWPFYTRPRYLPASRVDGCLLVRSMLAEGTVLVDSKTEDTVLGVGTHITGAVIRRSLIMGRDPNTPVTERGKVPIGIGAGTVIENAIIDKNARIGRNVKMLAENRTQEADGDCWVIRDGILVTRRGADIPDGTIL